MGAVETVEATRDRGIAVTVYFGQRKGSASTADLREDSLDATVEQACAIARHTEDDVAAGLADPALMATRACANSTAGIRGRWMPIARSTWRWPAKARVARMRGSRIPMARRSAAAKA